MHFSPKLRTMRGGTVFKITGHSAISGKAISNPSPTTDSASSEVYDGAPGVRRRQTAGVRELVFDF
jgi:hypothetical protein